MWTFAWFTQENGIWRGFFFQKKYKVAAACHYEFRVPIIFRIEAYPRSNPYTIVHIILLVTFPLKNFIGESYTKHRFQYAYTHTHTMN